MSQGELFPSAPRTPRVFRMKMADAGSNPCKGPPHVAKFKCHRCDTVSDWASYATIEEIKRGIPCPKCNGQKGTT